MVFGETRYSSKGAALQLVLISMKKWLSEFIGTFALVFFGTGAIIVDEISQGKITHVGVSMCFGLIVMAMIYALGEKSGAHLNPAVTISFCVYGNFPVNRMAPYIISQIAGALMASLVLKALFPASISLGSTIPSGSNLQSFILEFLLTFFLMLVILSVATGSKEQGLFAGIAIGSVILLEALFGGPISGASMNPARSLAPALVSGNIHQLWIYILAPVSGAMLASAFHKLIQ
jgi:aquaporin NIP